VTGEAASLRDERTHGFQTPFPGDFAMTACHDPLSCDRRQWNALPEEEARRGLEELLETRLSGFKLKRFERFSRFSMETYTMLLDHDGSEFVFVPGDGGDAGARAVDAGTGYLATHLKRSRHR